MKLVYKFGGASIASAELVRNAAAIIASSKGELKVVVASAMAKTTNALEAVLGEFILQKQWHSSLLEIKNFHFRLIDELDVDGGTKQGLYEQLNKEFDRVVVFLQTTDSSNHDFIYDQLISLGEICSTRILASFLAAKDIHSVWIDSKKLIRTDNSYRHANVNIARSKALVDLALSDAQLKNSIWITQGFLGSTNEGFRTTLGREGSDYTAALLANLIDAQQLVVWKDVPGVMTADPKIFPRAKTIEKLSYREIVEMSYFGAKVLHPKTIKPLQNAGIQCEVRSFKEPTARFTTISNQSETSHDSPILMSKENQVLLSFKIRDFSFVNESNISDLFSLLSRLKIRVNMWQTGAISFSICIDQNQGEIDAIYEALSSEYEIRHNEGLELITVRYYGDQPDSTFIKERELFLEQRTRSVVRFLVK